MEKVNAKILVVDDDPDILTAARVVLRQKFALVETENNPQKLKFLINQNRYDVILLDMNYTAGKTSGSEGILWLKEILTLQPQQQVVMITAYGDIKLAVEAMKQGAADFIVKPWDNEKLEATIQASFQHSLSRNELNQLKKKQTHYSRVMNDSATEIVGASSLIKEVLNTVTKISPTDANILLLGENGTGKELIAKLIHQQSLRKDQPFIKVDVGSLSPTLFESELFGHKKGAFTDAREDRIGRMELAHGGTLFLDEVGNIPLPLQSKLLSALQNREITPIGGNTPVSIDIRLVSATNSKLHDAVGTNQFREDLLYRINTVEITIPPLRQRPEDIPLLARHFLDIYTAKYRKEKNIGTETLKYIQKYSWPGNVRELQHAIERAVIMSEHSELAPRDFLFSSRKETDRKEIINLDEMEKNAITAAIRKYQGNMSKVSRELGIGRTTLYRKMSKYGLSNPEQN
jgi:two-component system response regulator HydG